MEIVMAEARTEDIRVSSISGCQSCASGALYEGERLDLDTFPLLPELPTD
jgi:hypothetical protein